ncbi:MAG TPA: response regulator [Acidimicrobiales bacterium]|nr:response regulator [Acidimicrobiales bacterium]
MLPAESAATSASSLEGPAQTRTPVPSETASSHADVHRSATVLVVDDEAAIRKLFASKLIERGYRTLTAGLGSKAFALAAHWPPDLILLDLKLPDMSGLAFLRLLRLRGTSCRVVIVSGFLTEAATEEALGLGVACAISKPLSVDRVTKEVAEVLASHVIVQPIPSNAGTAYRLASLVLRACDGDADLRTLSVWARRIGTSAGALRRLCRLAGAEPHDVRDLARMLNAVVRAHLHDATIEAMLDVGDERTLERLMTTSGLRTGDPPPGIPAFLRLQRFVSTSNHMVRVLLGLVG